MTKELIEIIRQSLIPFVKKELLDINYEGLGKSDAEEFEKDLNEVLDMAIKVLEQQSSDCVSRTDLYKILKLFGGQPLENDITTDLIYLVKDSDIVKLPPVTPKLSTSDDCVSRQAVLDMAITIQTDDYSGNKILDVVEVEDIKDIRALPTVTPTQRWIPVSERLPEPNRLVVCYITTGTTETYFLALWNDIQKAWEEGIGGYRLLERDLGYEVLAWQPLPKPYEEKRGSEK